MALIDFIQKIQRKPRYVRIQILWLAVFVCMLLVASFWVASLKQSLSTVSQETKTAGESFQALKKDMPSLKETFKASLGVFFEEDLADELEKLEETENQAELDSQTETNQLAEPEIKPAKLPLSD